MTSTEFRTAVEIVCQRIRDNPEWRRAIAAETCRGDLLLAYVNDETIGHCDAAIASHFDLIHEAEDLLDAERQARQRRPSG